MIRCNMGSMLSIVRGPRSEVGGRWSVVCGPVLQANPETRINKNGSSLSQIHRINIILDIRH